ncbi:hypothetical protein [Streptomyces sp. S.PNR 29]|uniref:hypothetical protein n=1 Tax=Streptomyces sp. S.PNR 29 TaxID=2973805 RepID=UPI0025B1D38F|nr:hypothetical protein [Streptomyces sp. S.PNR 29]MDN0198316.1 hypothetical protein [Streptomyces sp. S.PNR 29]
MELSCPSPTSRERLGPQTPKSVIVGGLPGTGTPAGRGIGEGADSTTLHPVSGPSDGTRRERQDSRHP